MKIYIETPASEPPKESGKYLTNDGELHFQADIDRWIDPWVSDVDNEVFTHPKFWLKTITPEAITWEEAKNRLAQNMGYHRWREYRQDFPTSPDNVFDKVAELYLQQNTAALRDRIEKLEKQKTLLIKAGETRQEFINELAKQYATKMEVDVLWEERDRLNEQLKTLADALKSAQVIVNDYAFQYGEMGTHIAMEVSKAIALAEQDNQSNLSNSSKSS